MKEQYAPYGETGDCPAYREHLKLNRRYFRACLLLGIFLAFVLVISGGII